jgi:hypothetical protein
LQGFGQSRRQPEEEGMRSIRVLAVAVATFGLMAAAPAAMAGDTRCVGVLPPGIYDNVVVPSGASCVIAAAEIRGNLKAEPGSQIIDVRNSTIHGNVEGDSFSSFDLHGSTVEGNVTLKKFKANVQVCGTMVHEDLQVEEGQGRVELGRPATGCAANQVGENLQAYKNVIAVHLAIDGNMVGKNLQVYETMGPGPKSVEENTVGQIVQCFKNQPPFKGGPNEAPEREGECF